MITIVQKTLEFQTESALRVMLESTRQDMTIKTFREEPNVVKQTNMSTHPLLQILTTTVDQIACVKSATETPMRNRTLRQGTLTYGAV